VHELFQPLLASLPIGGEELETWRGYASDRQDLFPSPDESVRQVILIGPRASCALTRLWMRPILSAQDARGPMIMIGHGYTSARPGGSSLCPALEIRRVCVQFGDSSSLARLCLGPTRPVFAPRQERAPGHPHWTARILRAHAPVNAPDPERAGCARSNDHDRARLRLGPTGQVQPVSGVGNSTRLHAVRRLKQAGEPMPRTDKTCFRPPTRACAGSSSLDRAHPARSCACGCARS